jgi:hypothetical protein
MTKALKRFVLSLLLGTGLFGTCLLATSTARAQGYGSCAKDLVGGDFTCLLRIGAAKILGNPDLEKQLKAAGLDVRSQTEQQFSAIQDAIKVVDTNVLKVLALTEKSGQTFADFRQHEYDTKLKNTVESATEAFDVLNQQLYKNFTTVTDFAQLELKDPNGKSPASSLRNLFNNEKQSQLITILEELCYCALKQGQSQEHIKSTLPDLLKSYFDKLQAEKATFAKPDFSSDDAHNPLLRRVNGMSPHEESNLVLQKKMYNLAVDAMLVRQWATIQKIYWTQKFSLWYYYLGEGFGDERVALPGFIDVQRMPKNLKGEQLQSAKLAHYEKAVGQLNNKYYGKIQSKLNGDPDPAPLSVRAKAFKLFDDSVAGAGPSAAPSKIGGDWKSHCGSFTNAELTELSIDQVRDNYYYNGTFLQTMCDRKRVKAFFNLKLCDDKGVRGVVHWDYGRFRCANRNLNYLQQRLLEYRGAGEPGEEPFLTYTDLVARNDAFVMGNSAELPVFDSSLNWNGALEPPNWGLVKETRRRKRVMLLRFLPDKELYNGKYSLLWVNDPDRIRDEKLDEFIGVRRLILIHPIEWINDTAFRKVFVGCIRDDIFCHKVDLVSDGISEGVHYVHFLDGASFGLELNKSRALKIKYLAGKSDLDPVGRGTARSAAVSRLAGRVDAFWVGQDGAIWSQNYGSAEGRGRISESSKSDALPITGKGAARAGSPVVAVARKSDQLDIFWIGPNGEVKTTWWTEKGGWKSDGPMTIEANASALQLTVVSRLPHVLDVFWTNARGEIHNKRWTGTKDGWQSKGRITEDCAASGNSNACEVRSDSPVVALSRTPHNMDVFWIRKDGAVAMTSWNSDSDWNQKRPPSIIAEGAVAGSGLSAVARSASNLDVFWVAGNGMITGRSWWLFAPGDGWRRVRLISVPSEQRDVRDGSPLAAVARKNSVEVFWINSSGGVGRLELADRGSSGDYERLAFDRSIAQTVRQGSTLSVVNLRGRAKTRDVLWLDGARPAVRALRLIERTWGEASVLGLETVPAP